MKRRVAVLLAGVMACAMMMTGCGSKNNASNEYVTVAGYKGIEVPKVEEVEEVTDLDVQNYINSRINENTTAEAVTDRPVQTGDAVNIDFVGKMDGEVFDGGSAEGYELVIGSGAFIPGFEDSVIGHEIGETFDWNGKFPEDYTPEMAGKDVTFTITVNGIMTYNFPELNDEFVQKVSETSKTVDEYKAEVKKLLEEERQAEYDYILQEAVWAAVVDKAEVIKYPEGEVEDVTKSLYEQYESMAEMYGMEFEDFIIQQMGISVEEFDKQAVTAAEKSVKMQLVAKAIAEAEKLVPSEKGYEEEYEKLCEQYGYTSTDDLIGAAGGEDSLQAIIIERIVLDWLADNCIQVNE